MDFGIWWVKRKERTWLQQYGWMVSSTGEIPDGYALSCGFLGLGKPRLVQVVTC